MTTQIYKKPGVIIPGKALNAALRYKNAGTTITRTDGQNIERIIIRNPQHLKEVWEESINHYVLLTLNTYIAEPQRGDEKLAPYELAVDPDGDPIYAAVDGSMHKFKTTEDIPDNMSYIQKLKPIISLNFDLFKEPEFKKMLSLTLADRVNMAIMDKTGHLEIIGPYKGLWYDDNSYWSSSEDALKSYSYQTNIRAADNVWLIFEEETTEKPTTVARTTEYDEGMVHFYGD